MQFVMLIIVVLFYSTSLYANNEIDSIRGYQVAKKIVEYDTGWTDSIAQMQMVIHGNSGDKAVRELTIKSLEVDNDGDKSLVVFHKPRDIAGSKFLSHTHALSPDNQWIFLPTIKRVKRVSSANKSGPFMGSQFAYEDLSSFEIDKYNYRYVGEGRIGAHEILKLENTPRYEHSGYTKLITWVDINRYIPLRIDFYDRKGALLKTLVYNQYKKYDSKYWRANKLVMKNKQTGMKTVIRLKDLQLNTGLSDSEFSRNALK